MGPLHDMMQSVHEVAGQGRRTNDLLREFWDLQNDILREKQHDAGVDPERKPIAIRGR